MKAIILNNKGSAEQLNYKEAETPEISDDEALVKLKAASVNHLDIWVREGHFPVSYPIILGCEGSGDIASAGNNVEIDVRNFYRSNFTMLGTSGTTHKEVRAAFELVKEGKIKPIIDRVFPLKDASLAHKYLEERRNFGKVVLEVG